MNRLTLLRSVLALLALFLCPATVRAAVEAKAGPYQLTISADPGLIAVGNARLLVEIRDSDGAPVEGATVTVLAKMPTMDMGERTETARPVSDSPGSYEAPAVFSMKGDYIIVVSVDGPAGAGEATVNVATGQDLSVDAVAGPDYGNYLLWVFVALFVAFTAYRMRRTGQGVNFAALLRPATLVGIALLVALYMGARYAVTNLRRDGAMTPIEAQAMDMSSMPAPEGKAPVVLATVERGRIQATVRYTGTAVGFTEENVVARVAGWIVWMPLYPGDRVRAGQVIARLDTSELTAKVDERSAQRAMARYTADMAREDISGSEAGLAQRQADIASRQGDLAGAKARRSEAQAMVRVADGALEQGGGALASARAQYQAAQEAQQGARASLEATRATEADAQAALASAQADDDYWRREIARMKTLLAAGAVSGEEYQREEAQAKNAAAKVQQARARIRQVRNEIDAAAATEKRSGSLVVAARAKVTEQEASIRTLTARIERAHAGENVAASQVTAAEGALSSAREAVKAAQARVGANRAKHRHAQSAERSASAAQRSASIVRGYAEIRSRTTGVVTQRLISPGTLVQPGQALLKLAQVQPIRLQANLSEVDLARVRMGAPVTIRAQGSSAVVARARVTSIFPAVDPVARTGIVEVQYANADRRVLPGQFLLMDIGVGERDDAILIPTVAVHRRAVGGEAVIASEESTYVWAIMDHDGELMAHRREVRLGLSDGERVEVVEGLTEGEQVIVRGGRYLRDGDWVVASSTADSPTAERPPPEEDDQPAAEHDHSAMEASDAPGDAAMDAGDQDHSGVERHDDREEGDHQPSSGEHEGGMSRREHGRE